MIRNNKDKRSRALPKISEDQLLLFLLWPFGSLIYSLKNFRLTGSRTLFWLFCIYFGFVFVYSDPFSTGGGDSAHYAAELIDLNENFISFEELVNKFYTKGGRLDIYQPLITWIVAIFTGNPRVLFAVFAAVFGFFYTQNIWMAFNTINKKKIGWVLFIFLISYAFIIPIWQINGVRMWTAAQIYLYGILQFFLKKDKNGLFWSTASLFVHFSFFLPITLILAWRILPKNFYLLFTLYIITALIGEINIEEIKGLISNLPELFQQRIDPYTTEERVESYRQEGNKSWHVVLANTIFRWATYAWVIALFLKRKRWSLKQPLLLKLFKFALLFGSLANITAQIPSGQRFLILGNAIFFVVFIGLLGKNEIKLNLKLLKKLSMPFLIYLAIFNIRFSLNFIGLLTFAGNPLIAIPLQSKTPLIEFIKNLL